MSKPYWFAAFSGTAATAWLIHSWADDEQMALTFLAVLFGTLLALGLIDVYRTRTR